MTTPKKPRAGQAHTPLHDVLAVSIQTGIVRFFGQNKDIRNAEAIVKMAIMRRGVDEEFYAVVPAGSHKEGDKYKENGV
jgi:hypothetical protein